ncbi:MAG: magnesium and cobalt exporter, family, partial [Subtercola sp.]|nr:magnesium and cobalt exporter, family [Subtercola sp.]
MTTLPSVGPFIAIALALVALGGFFASADSAMASLSRADILDLAERARAKRSIRAIAEDTGAHINVVNFVRVVAETSAAVLVTIALSATFEQIWVALLLSILIMTGVSFVLVGSSPRSVGRVHARGVLVVSALPVHLLRVLLGPIANALVLIGNRVTPGRVRSASFSSEEQ